MNDDDEDDIDFRIAGNLAELSARDLEHYRRGELPIILWPLAIEYPDEGDIPSEVQPARSRPFGRWEAIEVIPDSPLHQGDTFSTRVYDGRQRVTSITNTYRVLGRTPGLHHDWLVVEQLDPFRAVEPTRARPELRVAHVHDSYDGERRLVAGAGASRWRLGVDAKSGRHVAKAMSGWETERHGYSRDEITRALVDAHMMWDEPLPDVGPVQQQHWKRSGERYREGLRPFEWTLSTESGVRITKGTVQAVSFRQALDLATRDAFGDTPREPPSIDEATRRVWTHFRSTKILEVRRVG